MVIFARTLHKYFTDKCPQRNEIVTIQNVFVVNIDLINLIDQVRINTYKKVYR